jgi:hypothetical protein
LGAGRVLIGSWALAIARLARAFSDAGFTPRALEALSQSLTAENILQEVAYLLWEGRGAFERPYGLAWLLLLGAELHEKDDPRGQQLAANSLPLAVIPPAVWQQAMKQAKKTLLPKS